MTPSQQATLEQAAVAVAERIKAVVGPGAWYGTTMCRRQTDPKPLDMRVDACKILYEVLAAQRAAVLEAAATHWSHRSAMTDNWEWAQCCDTFVEWLKKQAQEQRP